MSLPVVSVRSTFSSGFGLLFMRRFALLAMASERAFLASEGAISFFCNHGANGCERYVLLVSMCASETDTCMMDVVSDMHVMRTRVDLSDVRHSVLSAQLSSVCVCVFFFN